MKSSLPLTQFLTLFFVTMITILSGCSKSETDTNSSDDPDTYTITITAFSKDNPGNYTSTGKTLTFNSKEECQTWSRTAGADGHSSALHLHYNAAAQVSFDNSTTTFNYTEYGPEIDQATIESTCAAGNNGVSKTVNDSSYYQDKPNVYLKITEVLKN